MDVGRPSSYNKEAAVLICTEISTTTKSLRAICMENEFLPNVSTVFRWLADIQEFRELYARAQEARADLLADEIIEIADDSSQDTLMTEKGEMENKEWVNRSKLRVDARKWIAAKLKPKKYGEKVEHSGEVAIKQITGMKVD